MDKSLLFRSSIWTIVESDSDAIRNEAMELAANLHNKQIIIYSDTELEGVAVRARQQINENAKELCWHHVLPEMNHNELVGWAGGSDKFAVIKLNSSFDYYRTQKRWEICKAVISEKTNSIYDVNAKGTSRLTQALYLIHLLDWVSCFLADLKNVDPVEVDVIIHLKTELSKLK